MEVLVLVNFLKKIMVVHSFALNLRLSYTDAILAKRLNELSKKKYRMCIPPRTGN